MRYMSTQPMPTKPYRRKIYLLTLGRRIINATPHYLRQLLPWNAIPALCCGVAESKNSLMGTQFLALLRRGTAG